MLQPSTHRLLTILCAQIKALQAARIAPQTQRPPRIRRRGDGAELNSSTRAIVAKTPQLRVSRTKSWAEGRNANYSRLHLLTRSLEVSLKSLGAFDETAVRAERVHARHRFSWLGAARGFR